MSQWSRQLSRAKRHAVPFTTDPLGFLFPAACTKFSLDPLIRSAEVLAAFIRELAA